MISAIVGETSQITMNIPMEQTASVMLRWGQKQLDCQVKLECVGQEDTMSKVVGIATAEAASPDLVMTVLKDALAYARKHNMNAAFIVMVPSDVNAVSFMKAATQITPEAIDTLLALVEDGHEVVYQLNT